MDNSALYRTASRMPALRHGNPDNKRFDVTESEAAKWLCSQPEVMQWVFRFAKAAGRLFYDAENGVWVGRYPKHIHGGRPEMSEQREMLANLMRTTGGAKRLTEWVAIAREVLGDDAPARTTIFKFLNEMVRHGEAVRDAGDPGKPRWRALPLEKEDEGAELAPGDS